MERPLWVTIFAISFWITALTDILLSLFFFQRDPLLGIYFLVTGIINYIVVWGLWFLKTWGWKAFIVLLLIGYARIIFDTWTRFINWDVAGATSEELHYFVISNVFGILLFGLLLASVSLYFYSRKEHFVN